MVPHIAASQEKHLASRLLQTEGGESHLGSRMRISMLHPAMTVFPALHMMSSVLKAAITASGALDASTRVELYSTMPLDSRLHVNTLGKESSLGIKPATRIGIINFIALATDSCRAPLGIAMSSSNLSRENGPRKLRLFFLMSVGPSDLTFLVAHVFLCEGQSFFWHSLPQ